jgi:hypothetical protein
MTRLKKTKYVARFVLADLGVADADELCYARAQIGLGLQDS